MSSPNGAPCRSSSAPPGSGFSAVLRDVAGAEGEPTADQRDDGTLATVVWCLDHGAQIVRVHDVRPAARAVQLLEIMETATP